MRRRRRDAAMKSRDDSEDRYEEILKRIAQRKPFGGKSRGAEAQTPQDQALDLVNAYDALAAQTREEFQHVLCYGPRALRGSAWSGALIWYHRKGYYGYQTLHLLGVWAHYREGECLLSMGIRSLPYRAPVYDAGVYRVAIQSNFRIYYDDAGGPPDKDDRLLYQVEFNETDRLKQRRALLDKLQRWRGEIQAG